ncbi:MAG TPA: RHS repeat-associated core domain-containing protein [Acidisarcina sp.]
MRGTAGMHYTYDAEGRVVTAGAETYSYDGDGNRVLKSAGGDSGSAYFYGAGGEVTDEQTVHLNPGTGTPGQVIRNLYFNGRLAYRMGFPEFAYPSLFIVGDQIGSSRTTVGLLGGTGSSGPTNFVTANTEFYPFGAYVTAPATNLEQQFTGKIRDVEIGNDYFGARYYSSSTGRFMSPDWAAKAEPVPYAKLDNPQSLNLYAYVRNNPLSRVDPNGHVAANTNCNQTQGAGTCEVALEKTLKVVTNLVKGGLGIAAAAVAAPEIGAAALAATTVRAGLAVGASALAATGVGVNGVAQVAGALTGTDMSKGTDMVTNVTSPVGAAVGLATGSAERGAQAADLVTVGGAARELGSGHGIGNVPDAAGSLGGAVDAVKSNRLLSVTCIQQPLLFIAPAHVARSAVKLILTN